MAIIAAGRKIALQSIVGNAAALGAGLLLALLLGEVCLRLIGLGHPYYSAPELYRPNPDPNVLFEPRPTFSGFSEGTTVHTNSLGLRERELPLQKAPGVSRIVFLGDSVTFGPGVRDDEAFPRLVEARLADLPAETVNAGVVGYNTTQELARLRSVGLAYQPDVVVLTFLVNDLLDIFSIFDHQYEPSGLLAQEKVWLRRNSRLYRFVQDTWWRIGLELRRARAGPSEPLRQRSRVAERLAELREMVDLSRANGSGFLLAMYPDNLDDPIGPAADGARRTVREELMRFAAEANVAVVDLSQALGDVRDPRAREFRLREDPHPSPEGHRVIADALADPLRELLASRSSGR